MSKEIEVLFDKYYNESHFSGAGLVKKSNSTIFANAYGYGNFIRK